MEKGTLLFCCVFFIDVLVVYTYFLMLYNCCIILFSDCTVQSGDCSLHAPTHTYANRGGTQSLVSHFRTTIIVLQHCEILCPIRVARGCSIAGLLYPLL